MNPLTIDNTLFEDPFWDFHHDYFDYDDLLDEDDPDFVDYVEEDLEED